MNYQGFVFAAPSHETQNVYIARADYNITQDAKQRLSVIGALRKHAGPNAAAMAYFQTLPVHRAWPNWGTPVIQPAATIYNNPAPSPVKSIGAMKGTQ